MKTAIGIIFLIGVVLILLAKRAERFETNPDDYASAFVMLAGMAVLVADAALIGIYAVYRLFIS